MTADPAERPRAVDGAALTTAGAAVTEAVLAATLLGRVATVGTDVAVLGGGADPDAVAGALIGVAVVVLLHAAVLVLLAILLRRRSRAARIALLVLSPLGLLVVVAPTTPGIVGLVLLGATVYLLLRRDVSAWFRKATADPSP